MRGSGVSGTGPRAGCDADYLVPHSSLQPLQVPDRAAADSKRILDRSGAGISGSAAAHALCVRSRSAAAQCCAHLCSRPQGPKGARGAMRLALALMLVAAGCAAAAAQEVYFGAWPAARCFLRVLLLRTLALPTPTCVP